MMRLAKYFLLAVVLFFLSGCSVPIFHFITNHSNSDLWLEYRPNMKFGQIFGDENSNRIRVKTDLGYTSKDLKKAAKKNPINKRAFIEEETCQIKLPPHETTYLGVTSVWYSIDLLIEELQVKIKDDSNQEVLIDLAENSEIEYGVSNLQIK